jgi:hypothetical protein
MPRWFFSYRFVDSCAEQLVAQYDVGAPADSAPPMKRKTAAKQAHRQEAAVDVLIAAALRFVRDEKLNFFQRARLAQQLQNRLMAQGRSVELARSVASAVSAAGA